jgi:hypothetical protein
MDRDIARACDCLQHEHDRVRAACTKVLAQNDKALERELGRSLALTFRQALLGTRCCSNSLVLLPALGSAATTVAVQSKLHERYVSFAREVG